MFLNKYGVARHIYIPVVKRNVVDFAIGADWTPAAGDVKISKDGGAAANVTNLPVAITMGNTAMWDFSLTTTELQAAQIVVTVADSATKAVEDQSFIIQTYGHASAMFQVDLADSVRAGLTALPNAAAGANGGLPLGDASARVDVGRVLGTAQTAGDLVALLVTATSYIDTEVGAIKLKTDNLPSDPADASDIASALAALSIPTASQNAAALLDLADAIESGLTVRQALRGYAAVLLGKASGLEGTEAVFRNAVADSKARVTATVDANGNRSAVSTDLT